MTTATDIVDKLMNEGFDVEEVITRQKRQDYIAIGWDGDELPDVDGFQHQKRK